MLNSGGAKIGEMRYYPFGETRLITGSVPTDRRYTGQRQESVALGSLYDYGARLYAPVLGRFLSADTIVPEPGNPQDFNRYSYSLNNPIKYIDPSGHSSKAIEDAAGLLGSGGGGPPTQPGDLERMAVTLIVGAAAFVGATYVAVTYGPILVAGAETLAARVTTKLAEGVGACAIANCSDKAKQAVERVSKACGGDCSDEISSTAQTAQQAMNAVRALGQAGEQTAGIVKNTLFRIHDTISGAAYRIPDEYLPDLRIISEVKNVAYQAYTGQLRDFLYWAEKNQFTFRLFVRESTVLSSELQKLVDSGRIILCTIVEGCP